MKIQKKISIFIVLLLGLGLASATLSNYINVSGSTNLKFSMRTVKLSPIKDSYIEQEQPNASHGSETILYVKSNQDNNERSVLMFDLSSIPNPSEIISANLYLYYYDFEYQNTTGRNYFAYKVPSLWNEDEVTWVNRTISDPWNVTGGDYITSNGVSITIPSSFGWVDWNVTDIVSDWMNGEANHGFLIKDDSEDALESGFRSKFRPKDYTGSEFDPYLEVVYFGG